MRIISRIVLGVMLACPAASAAAGEESRPDDLVVRLPPLESRGLDPALARAVTGLLGAAIESGGGCVVVADSGDPGGGASAWIVRPSVSGRGPWKLAVRAEGPSDAGARRFATEKTEFADRETLTDAVDAIAAQLRAGWRNAGVRLSGAGPVTLRRALSPSAAAADAYLAAVTALRSGRVDDGLSGLREALEADPGFSLAAAERAYADMTAGDGSAAREALAAVRRAPARSTDPDPAAALLEGLDRAAAAVPGEAVGPADRPAEAGAAGAPRLALAQRGLLLAVLGRWKEALEPWQRAVELDPADPRARYWLGLARMAGGDFQGAAADLGLARAAWPSLLRAYKLQAECQVRLRDTVGARATLESMKEAMTERGIRPSSDADNTELMLGAVDLLEGNSTGALERFEKTLLDLIEADAPADLTWTLHTTIIQMRRDYAIARDPLARSRQLDEARDALDRLRDSLPADLRDQVPCVFLRFEGLIRTKEGDTVEAWRAIEKMKAYAGTPAYSEVDEAYLTAATMLREGDVEGCAGQFERLARIRGGLVDHIDLAQIHLRLKRYEEARSGYLKIEELLSRHEPAALPPRSQEPPWKHQDALRAAPELILEDPHLAALVPFYHYCRARLAYETGDAEESRRHFNRMLKYYRDPDDKVIQLVKEAIARGAKPE